MLKKDLSDNYFKRSIANKLRKGSLPKDIYKDKEILSFGDDLIRKNIKNILTTNMDFSIENILCSKYNGFKEINPRNISMDAGEKIYSIRRKKTFVKGNYEINVWKIHGDNDVIPSILLGFDHYVGSLAKINAYLKGTYKSSSGIECRKSIKDKFNYSNDEDKTGSDKEKAFENDDISWIELFFNSNLYIAGLTLDYSEIDIWWLLNKRARLMNEGIKIGNKIVFLYNEYDNGDSIKNNKEIEGNKEYKKIDEIIDREIKKFLPTNSCRNVKKIEKTKQLKRKIIKSILLNEKTKRFEEKMKLFDLLKVKHKQIRTGDKFLKSLMAAIK